MITVTNDYTGESVSWSSSEHHNSFVEYNTDRRYIDCKNGNDASDGKSQATAWKSIDRFINELSDGSSIRAYIISPGVYEASFVAISNATIHITATVNDVTIKLSPANNSDTVIIYNSHLSFTCSNTSHRMTFTGAFIKAENCSNTLYYCNFSSGYQQVGGYIGCMFCTFKPNKSVNAKYTVDLLGCNGYLMSCTAYGPDVADGYPVYLHNGANVVFRNDSPETNGCTFISGVNGNIAPVYSFGSKMVYLDNIPVFKGKYTYGLRASSGEVQIPTKPYNAWIKVGTSYFTGASFVVKSNQIIYPAK